MAVTILDHELPKPQYAAIRTLLRGYSTAAQSPLTKFPELVIFKWLHMWINDDIDIYFVNLDNAACGYIIKLIQQ